MASRKELLSKLEAVERVEGTSAIRVAPFLVDTLRWLLVNMPETAAEREALAAALAAPKAPEKKPVKKAATATPSVKKKKPKKNNW